MSSSLSSLFRDLSTVWEDQTLPKLLFIPRVLSLLLWEWTSLFCGVTITQRRWKLLLHLLKWNVMEGRGGRDCRKRRGPTSQWICHSIMSTQFTYPYSSPWFGPFYVSNPLMAGTSLDGRIILLVAGSLLFTKALQSDSALGFLLTGSLHCSLMFLAAQAAGEQHEKKSPLHPPPGLRRKALADPGKSKAAVPPRSQLALSCCLSCSLTSFPSGIPYQFLTTLGVGLATGIKPDCGLLVADGASHQEWWPV